MTAPRMDDRLAVNGKPIMQNFANWFGASQAVDGTGAPLVVYHGSNAHAYCEGEIEQFHTEPESGRGAAFFTSDRALSAQYGERVYEVHLSLQNPLIIEGNDGSWSTLTGMALIQGQVSDALHQAAQKAADELTRVYADLGELCGDESVVIAQPRIPAQARTLDALTLGCIPGLDGDNLETDLVVKIARKMGFDGVIFRDIQDSPTFDGGYARTISDIFAVFHPEQVRKAGASAALLDSTMEKASEALAFVASVSPKGCRP